MSQFLKVKPGESVQVTLLAACTARNVSFGGEQKVAFDNKVRIVATGLETVWSHFSEDAQNRLYENADIGDTITIEHMTGKWEYLLCIPYWG